MTLIQIADWFARWGTWLWINLRIMQVWSKVYSWVWQRNKREKIQRYPGLSSLVKTIRTLKWRMDTWRELGDAVSDVLHVQWLIDHDPDKFIGDCDEFGRYSAYVIRNELKDDPQWGHAGIDTTFLLTVMWRKTGGDTWEGNPMGYGGHNVCLIHYLDGTWAFMDYGFPSRRCRNIGEVVKLVRDQYAQQYVPISYAWSDPETLRPVGCVRE